MKSVDRRDGTMLSSEGRSAVSDSLSVERPLQVNINGRAFAMTMRTPGDDEALVRGLLFSEQVTTDPMRLQICIDAAASGEHEVAEVVVPEVYLCEGVFERRALTATSSCGLCGQRQVDDQAPGQVRERSVEVEFAALAAMYEAMQAQQGSFEESGGCHAAAAFTAGGELLCVFEDIGRHNAVDKVIGSLLAADSLGRAEFMLVSGRISYEIVIKTGHARIPVLAAVSAASTLAVDTARDWGMMIFAFCRDDRATVYT